MKKILLLILFLSFIYSCTKTSGTESPFSVSSSSDSSDLSSSSSSSSSVSSVPLVIRNSFLGQRYDDTVVTYDSRDTITYPANSPVAINGKLQVIGTKLCNSKGIPIQLKGMSTMGPQWTMQFINNNVFDTLAYDWHADIVRLAIYIGENGYMHTGTSVDSISLSDSASRAEWRNNIDQWVYEIGKRGMYCLIDWHVLSPGDPWATVEGAKEFWIYMSKKHRNKDHVLFEICNEPNKNNNVHGTIVKWDVDNSDHDIKGFANLIVPIIRHRDPSNSLVIVGSENWSLNPESALGDELSYENIMYTFHYYTDLHGDLSVEKYQNLMKMPIFVTEWGQGQTDYDNYLSKKFIDWMFLNKISWCSWSINSGDNHGIFVDGVNPTGPFSGYYTMKGKILRNEMKYNQDNFDGNNNGPFKVITDIEGGGKVVKTPQKDFYNLDDEVNVAAVPNAGYEFLGWRINSLSSDSVLTYKMNRTIYLVAKFKMIGNYVLNGDFLYDNLGWSLDESIFSASVDYSNEDAHVTLDNGGSLVKFVNYYQEGFILPKGDYTVSFDCKSSEDRQIYVKVGEALGSKVSPVYLSDTLNVSTTSKPYSQDFTVTGDATEIRSNYLNFSIGGYSKSDIWFDNVKIEKK